MIAVCDVTGADVNAVWIVIMLIVAVAFSK
jgi:hypothetical protein